MPITGFFNDNANRSYPFVDDLALGFYTQFEESSSSGESWADVSSSSIANTFPSSAIVDFGCVLGVESTFVEGVDSVYLYGVARVGDFLMFEFRCTNAAMTSHNLLFSRKVGDAENTIEYADATPQGIPGSNFPATLSFADVVEERVCETRPLWEGYLVTGDLTELSSMLNATGDIWYAGGLDSTGSTSLKIEPALIQDMGKTYLRSVNLANEPRTKATPYESCSSSESISSSSGSAVYAPIDYGSEDTDAIINATCVDGPLIFKEGYNCHITQSSFDNSLTFSASRAAGKGEPCDEIPVNSSESAPDDSNFLSGGPSCYDLLTSINGVFGSGLTPSVLTLIAGPGIKIRPTDGVPHSLDVVFDLRDFTVCIAPPSESSQSLSSIESDSSSSSSSESDSSSSSSSTSDSSSSSSSTSDSSSLSSSESDSSSSDSSSLSSSESDSSSLSSSESDSSSLSSSESDSSSLSSSESDDGYECGTCGSHGWLYFLATDEWQADADPTGGCEESCSLTDGGTGQCIEISPYTLAAAQAAEGGSSADGTALSTDCECCCCGYALYSNNPFGSGWNSVWTLNTVHCDPDATHSAPTFRAAPGTTVKVCCDCPSSSESSESDSSSSSESSSSSVSDSSSSSSSESSSSGCEDCTSCSGKGYVIYEGAEGNVPDWTPHDAGPPRIPGVDGAPNYCEGTEWIPEGCTGNRCCDGYEPPDIGSLDFYEGDTHMETLPEGACGVSDLTWKKYCCEPVEDSSCSMCSEEMTGFTLWMTDTNADGWPDNINWVQVHKYGPNLDKTAQCCEDYAPLIPAPDAGGNYTPEWVTYPEAVYRKECCVCNELGVNNACDDHSWGDDPGEEEPRQQGDFSCTCSECGWAAWNKRGGIAGRGPWVWNHDELACKLIDGKFCVPTPPAWRDWDFYGGAYHPGAEIVGTCFYGVDSVLAFTCCVDAYASESSSSSESL